MYTPEPIRIAITAIMILRIASGSWLENQIMKLVKMVTSNNPIIISLKYVFMQNSLLYYSNIMLE
jgi:hypothetical protein